MSIIKRKKNKNFTVINNLCLRDEDISAKAKGIYAYLMTLPEDWEIHKTELHKHFKDGRESIRAGFEELVVAGYIQSIRVKGEDGKFDGWRHTVYETPTSEKPQSEKSVPTSENPISVNPISENPTLLNTNNILNTNKTKKEGEKDFQEEFTHIVDQKKDIIKTIDVEKIYYAYPSKCFKSGRATGKSKSLYPKIKKQIKDLGLDLVLRTISWYVDNCKKTDTPLKNFGTFLNNFPEIPESEPESIPTNEPFTLKHIVGNTAEERYKTVPGHIKNKYRLHEDMTPSEFYYHFQFQYSKDDDWNKKRVLLLNKIYGRGIDFNEALKNRTEKEAFYEKYGNKTKES